MIDRVNARPEWFTVFRTYTGNERIYKELRDGRLRQGWGKHGLALERDGERVDKAEWEEAHRSVGWGDPSPRRFSILSRMLDIRKNDLVVMPKMPNWDQFSIARVNERYRFEVAAGWDDFGHILPVDSVSVRTFNYWANDKAFIISGLFSRASHRPAVSFAYGDEHVDAALKLLEMESDLQARSLAELSQARMNAAYREAAMKLEKEVESWNGPLFEKAVRQAFRDQGYKVKEHAHYDRKGGDIDILVSPPVDRFRLFIRDMPNEIAVQVKWKQGIGKNDEDAVTQIVDGVKSLGYDNAAKYVISSASGFTEDATTKAEDNGVVLISGVETMCFLLGFPERFREDWQQHQR